MPIQSLTREDIRLAVGHNLAAVFEGITSGAGSTTTLVDAGDLYGGDDNHIGKHVVITGGASDGDIRQVSDYVASTTTITFAPASTGTAGIIADV